MRSGAAIIEAPGDTAGGAGLFSQLTLTGSGVAPIVNVVEATA
jgi:hypothetical protein